MIVPFCCPLFTRTIRPLTGGIGEAVWLDLDLADPHQAEAAAPGYPQYVDLRADGCKLMRILQLTTLECKPHNYRVSAPCSRVSVREHARQVRLRLPLTRAALTHSCSHLSPFLYTNTPLPLLITTMALSDADVHIVNVSPPSPLSQTTCILTYNRPALR